MASTYKFTVRAEDDHGAFADREFSIVVRNTSVDRYMAVDNTDAYTSPDLINWTKRNGQGGFEVKYGGGKWMIISQWVNNTTSNDIFRYRLSADGVNFTDHTFYAPVGDVYNLTSQAPVWDEASGHWWFNTATAVNSTTTTALTQRLYKSPDGIEWTEVYRSPAGVTNGNKLVYLSELSFHNGFVYIGGLASTVASTAMFGYLAIPYNHNISDDIAPVVPTTPVTPSNNMQVSSPFKVNDLWIRSVSHTASFQFIYSSDLNTWYVGNFTGANAGIPSPYLRYNSFEYINGMLVCSRTSYGGAASSHLSAQLIVSKNGRDWNSQNTAFPPNAVVSANRRVCMIQTKGKIITLNSQGQFRETTDLFQSASTSDIGLTASANWNGLAMIK